jgi:hypothetical protein
MIRKTTLVGDGRPGKIVVEVRTDSKNEGLTIHEHRERHESLVESVHAAMSGNGCYSHQIKTR